MNKQTSNLLSFRRWAIVLSGLLLAVFAGFYFFNVSAQTDAVSKHSEQSLVNGRLAFSIELAGPGQPGRTLSTANADGSGVTTVVGDIVYPNEPAWSPDGTKLAFATTQFGSDIYVINANGTGQTNLTNTAEPMRERNPSWSVTGKIAFERSAQIWTMNADGSEQAQFITQPGPSGPVWSPNGLRMAFASAGEIWVINADGTGEQRVTNSASTDADPAWSPDGLKIVYGKGGSGINVVGADGQNDVPLTSTFQDITPSWSPDGTKIAFRRSNGTGRGIYTMDANGANQVLILTDQILFPLCCDRYPQNPAWQPVAQTPNTFTISGRATYNSTPLGGITVNLSGTTNASVTTDAIGNYQFSGLPAGGNYTVSPSAQRHYFTPPNRSMGNLSSNQTADFEVLGVCVGGKCVKNGKIAFGQSDEIFTVNPDGTGQTNITNNAASDIYPNWSPDGSNIIFATDRDGNSEIYRMSNTGGSPVNLSNNPASDYSPYYSPDGASIVFSSNRDGNFEIYKMNFDGSNQVRLTNTATVTEFSAAFSPDGQKIVFRTSESQTPPKLSTINADGTNRQELPGPGLPGDFYSDPSYSPDGSKIIFVYGADITLQRIWTMDANGTNRVQFPANGRYPSYSPDGQKVAYSFCIPCASPDRLSTVNANGSSVQTFSPTIPFVNSTDWQPLLAPRPASFDFDGDGRSDVSVYRPADGVWHQLRSTGGYVDQPWGLSNDVLTPADYDGDMKTDLAVWRGSEAKFYILNSFDSTFRLENLGSPGDTPTGGDWDGDGKADPAVYRDGGQSTIHYRGSMGNPLGNITSIDWGTTGDKPVLGDFDGDGRTDPAVFRPSSGIWYVRQSSNLQWAATNFGLASDVPVPADYDGDGKTDIAVYRDGIWYLLRSAQGYTSFHFGIANDKPAPADYDGDGRADLAIFRNGTWWILKSQSGAAESFPFGLGTDKPIPSAFVR